MVYSAPRRDEYALRGYVTLKWFRARVSATYIRRRSSSVSSSLFRQRAEGNQPSTAQITNTASHSLPFAECAVLRMSASSSSFVPLGKSCVACGGSSASADRNEARSG